FRSAEPKPAANACSDAALSATDAAAPERPGAGPCPCTARIGEPNGPTALRRYAKIEAFIPTTQQQRNPA
ncbi:TPA: hypothetical protein ACXND4_005649, partial [Burkholderia multivorans]